jgi:hypothetical protein
MKSIQYLRVSSTGSTTLDSKGRSLRGLSYASKNVLVQLNTQSLNFFNFPSYTQL